MGRNTGGSVMAKNTGKMGVTVAKKCYVHQGNDRNDDYLPREILNKTSSLGMIKRIFGDSTRSILPK